MKTEEKIERGHGLEGEARKWFVGLFAVHSLRAGDRQALPTGLQPTPSPSPAGVRQASKVLAAEMWVALRGGASIFLVSGRAGTCQHPRRAPQHSALVGANPKPK